MLADFEVAAGAALVKLARVAIMKDASIVKERDGAQVSVLVPRRDVKTMSSAKIRDWMSRAMQPVRSGLVWIQR